MKKENKQGNRPAGLPAPRRTTGIRGGVEPNQTMRKQAEEIAGEQAAQAPENSDLLSAAETRQVLHELRVHQIELEMQNEELRRTQVELDAARARYFTLYDLAPLGYCTSSEKGLILEANLAAATLLGLTRDSLVRQRFTRFVLPSDQDVLYRHRQQLLNTAAPHACELQMLKNDGLSFWAHLEEVIMQDDQGERVYLSMLSDISERKRTEQKLAQYSHHLDEMVAERTRQLIETQEQLVRQERLAVLGQIAGSVSHELRNPLSVILNAVYFVKLIQPDAEEKVQQYLDMIEQEARSAEKIITDLLDFTRIKSADRQQAAINELVAQTLARFPPPDAVTVALEIPAGLPAVFADPQQIVQVLGNLIANACQSMSAASSAGDTEDNKLIIGARQQDSMIVITVSDTGIGIPPENMQKLFEPLYTTRPKGIGLGLTICQKLVEANGGRIQVQSEIGKGATFTISLQSAAGVS